MESLFSFSNHLRKPHNHLEENKPLYKYNEFQHELNPKNDLLNVVSYNINNSKNVEQASELFQSHKDLSSADVILLQEMDISGIELLSQDLGLNYVFLPINSNHLNNRYFGNGILAKEKFITQSKLILPHGQTHNSRRRSLTKATIMFQGVEIQLASAHMATQMMQSKNRKRQITYVKEHINNFQSEETVSIIGGDFNSLTARYRRFISKEMQSIDHVNATQGLGSTIRGKIPGAVPELDIIFAKNLRVVDKGKIENKTVSDHFPIWVKLGLNQ